MLQTQVLVKRRRESACSEPDALCEEIISEVTQESLLHRHLQGKRCHKTRLWFKFVFATLRPMQAFFVPLLSLPFHGASGPSNPVLAGDLRLALGQHAYREQWTYETGTGTWETGDVFESIDANDIAVFPQCHFAARCLVLLTELSDGNETPLTASKDEGTVLGQRPQKRSKSDESVLAEAAEHPLMAAFMDDVPAGGKHSTIPSTAARGVGSTDDVSGGAGDYIDEDGDLTEAFAAVEAERVGRLAADASLQDEFNGPCLEGSGRSREQDETYMDTEWTVGLVVYPSCLRQPTRCVNQPVLSRICTGRKAAR
eukprot:3118926-Amphidinium_carterae.5